MSDLENNEIENVEDHSTEVEHDPINDFIDAIAAGDFNQSEELFNSLLADKVQNTLEAEKIAVADTIFNGADPLDIEDDIEIEAEDEGL
jgi:hypothetical protein